MMPHSDGSDPEGVSDVSQSSGSETPYLVRFPQKLETDPLQQDEEYAEVQVGKKKTQKIRIHDYNSMYAHPGLYEYIVHDQLACDSPRTVVQFLKEYLASASPVVPTKTLATGPLTILDVAAGNGIVGAELRQQLAESPGIRRLIGTDLLESARSAALRDRPTVYDDYVAADLTQASGLLLLPSSSDLVVICAALGPGDGDLPLEAVDGAIALLREGGLLTLTVNASGGQRGAGSSSSRWQGFMESVNGSGSGASHWPGLEEVARQRFRHRRNVQGMWIDGYMAVIYRKLADEGD